MKPVTIEKWIALWGLIFVLLFFTACEEKYRLDSAFPEPEYTIAPVPQDPVPPEPVPPDTNNHKKPTQVKPPEKTSEVVQNYGDVPIRLVFQTGGVPLKHKVQVILRGKIIAETDSTRKKIKIKDADWNDSLVVRTDFFQEAKIHLDPTVSDRVYRVVLEPLYYQIQVKAEQGVSRSQLQGVQIFWGNELLAETDADGLAAVQIPRPGKIKLTFFKKGLFDRQSFTINFNDMDITYPVILRPRQHVLAVQIEDDTGQPIRNVSVELVGGQAQNKGITDLNGRVVFKNYNLIPGEPYKLVISALNYQNGNFSFGEENLDNPQNPVRLTIPLRYEWTVSTDVPGAQITILDIRGKKVAEGTSPLRIKLPKGVFTVVARSGSQEKRESLNTANTRSSFRKVIVLKDPYDFVKKWADTHPGQVLPEDFANLLKGIKATSSNFVNSRLLLAKMYIQEERYRDAVKAYNEIFAGNKQAQYNPNLLFLAAQARMLYSEKLDPNSDEYRAILQEALEKYADVATAYMAHVPMKKKKEVYMRIKFLRGEIAQRLFFHYQEKNKYDLARLYREKALDHLVEFIHDYEALGNGSPLKTDFQQNYHRAQELVSTIKATGVY